jgi:hypothetical protein
MVLEAVYEQDFLPCSFGFRPGRSAHQALQSLHTAVMGQGLRWVIDIDIVKYFDSIPHSQLRDGGVSVGSAGATASAASTSCATVHARSATPASPRIRYLHFAVGAYLPKLGFFSTLQGTVLLIRCDPLTQC